MRVRVRRAPAVAGGLLGMALLVGCADHSEVITWTDEHGRACTGVAVVDGDDGDREVSSIDCDYPPAGKVPGRSTSRKLPD